MNFDEEFRLAVGEMRMKPSEFWALTYAEFVEMLNGYIRGNTRRNNDLLYLAWHVALFNRQKTLPSLNSILIEDMDSRHEQTDEEMLSMVKILNAALGGKVVER